MTTSRMRNEVIEKALSIIIFKLIQIERTLNLMANDFSALTATIEVMANEVAEVVEILQNPVIDNNDQTTIDSLTSKLSAAADALKAAIPAPSGEPTSADSPSAA